MKTYLRHRICNVIDIKELIALEFLDFEGKYKGYVESHDFWEICYVVDGRIEVFLDNISVKLEEHQLLLIPPNRMHSYFSDGGNRNRVFVVCFDSFSQVLSPISEHVFESDPVQVSCMDIIIDESATTFYMNSREQLEILDTPCFGGQQALLMQLEYLLIRQVRRRTAEKNSRIVFFSDDSFCADLVSVMLRFLRENVHRKLTLHDICSKFNYSRSFLCKTFKEQTGESLFTCFNRMKMEEAKRLLTETTLPIIAIACSLGFREAKYFDEVFKKQTGVTPVYYRKQEIEKKELQINSKEDNYE